MVFQFFRSGEGALEHVQNEIITMVGSCRHSFDLAMGALVTDADIGPVGEEVRATDRTINGIEETVRRELVVHSAVHGGDDVGAVLGYLLIVKKLERVGDQAKNVFDLAGEGVRFSDAPDYERFVEFRNSVSTMFSEASSLLSEPNEQALADLTGRVGRLMDTCDRLVNELIHSDEPASYAVPRAMLFRYLKRIAANLLGVVQTGIGGIDRISAEGVDLDE